MRTQNRVAEGELPLLVEPESAGEAGVDGLLAWAAERREWIEAQLLRCGGVLLRGFAVESAEEFERISAALVSELRRYVGGDSPRTSVTEAVYTSTEYPSHLSIPLHNEMSYARRWPDRIFFFCAEPPTRGGETPIGDCRKILQSLAPEIRERFEEKGICYVRNLHGGWGLGRSWQQTFETSDKRSVERHCREADVEFRWEGDGLHLSERRPAVIAHPRTGERVWFNQADLWHVSRLGPKRQAALLKRMKEEELPQHSLYGDGSPIAPGDLQAVQRVYDRIEVVFPWRRGDVLVLDNVLAAHGRRPFEGPRRILTAMG